MSGGSKRKGYEAKGERIELLSLSMFWVGKKKGRSISVQC